MKKVQCLKCSEIWYGDDKDISRFKLCPFCGVRSFDKEKIEAADTLDKALYCAYNEYGAAIFQQYRRLCAYMMDISSNISKELKIFSRILNQEYAQMLFELFSNHINVQSVIQNLKIQFMDNEGLTEQWANLLCQSIATAYNAQKGYGYIKYNFDVSDFILESKPSYIPNQNIQNNTSSESQTSSVNKSTQQNFDMWICPSCGKSNAKDVGTCSCGEVKPFNMWTCPNCGKTNAKYVGTCGCGEVQPFDFEDTDTLNWIKSSSSSRQSAESKQSNFRFNSITKQNVQKNNFNSQNSKQPSNMWTCPNCGKINAKYVGTCGCGEIQPFDFGD